MFMAQAGHADTNVVVEAIEGALIVSPFFTCFIPVTHSLATVQLWPLVGDPATSPRTPLLLTAPTVSEV